LREFTDLDLLLSTADVPRARELLGSQGFQPCFPLSRAQEEAYLRSIGQLPLQRRDGCLVELHATLVPPAFSLPLGLSELRQRLEPVQLAGHEVATFSREDLFLLLCAHAAKHLWVSLGWVCDIAELTRVSPGMDWERVQDQARRLNGQRLVWIGVLLAHHLLAAPLPRELVRRAQADARARRLADGLGRRFFEDQDQPSGSLQAALFYLQARERRRDGIRYCLALALAPTVADWTAVSLPPSLTSCITWSALSGWRSSTG
jgi:hypothetical protein